MFKIKSIRRLRLWLRFQPIGLTGRWVEAYGSESRFTQILKLKAESWRLKAIHRLNIIRR